VKEKRDDIELDLHQVKKKNIKKVQNQSVVQVLERDLAYHELDSAQGKQNKTVERVPHVFLMCS